MDSSDTIPADLAPFAHRFFLYLQTTHPEVIRSGTFVKYEKNWRLELQDAKLTEKNRVYVYADDGEVTVGLGEFAHSHFPMFDDGQTEEANFAEAVREIENLLEERAVAVRCGRFWPWFSTMPADQAIKRWEKKPHKVEIRSFHGTFDRLVYPEIPPHTPRSPQ